MSTIRIPAKYARALISETPHPLLDAALDCIRQQMSRKPKTAARKKTEEKKATKRDETEVIRGAVFKRAGNACENCGASFNDYNPGELDHFWGRAKAPQSVTNCWALCRLCHHAKTNNDPDAVRWLYHFGNHCDRQRFASEGWKVEARLASLKAVPKHISTVDLVGDGVAAKTWRSFQKGGEK